MAQTASDKLVLKDLKDHLKHAQNLSEALKAHGKIHFATTFFKEAINMSKDVLDDDAVSELIKSLNILKNEKVKETKRKVKGQAQKAKRDKKKEAEARKIQVETLETMISMMITTKWERRTRMRSFKCRFFFSTIPNG